MLKQSSQRITEKVQLLLTAYAVPAGTELSFYDFQIKKQFFTLTFILYPNQFSSFGLWRGFSVKYVLSSYLIQKPIFYATNSIGFFLLVRFGAYQYFSVFLFTQKWSSELSNFPSKVHFYLFFFNESSVSIFQNHIFASFLDDFDFYTFSWNFIFLDFFSFLQTFSCFSIIFRFSTDEFQKVCIPKTVSLIISLYFWNGNGIHLMIAYFPLFLLIFSQFPCHFLTIRNKKIRLARKV